MHGVCMGTHCFSQALTLGCEPHDLQPFRTKAAIGNRLLSLPHTFRVCSCLNPRVCSRCVYRADIALRRVAAVVLGS